MPLLELDRVAHAYGQHTVVRELSFALARGEIGCLLGASGCGKTTALRLIAGFEQPTAGEVRIAGEVVGSPAAMVPPERRSIGMVFQEYALFPHELSGGQQQRVALARALAPKPRLLLLDEPFSNLDVELRERLALEVRDIIKATGTTAILVTHDQHEAFAVADVVGIIQHGRVEQWATPYDLYHRPATRFVADFVGQGAFLAGTVLDRETVEVELGRLRSAVPLDCADSCATCGRHCRLQVLLRPDDLIHDDGAPFQAEVVAKAFRGAEFLYTLRLPSGARVLSLVPSHHNHAIGEKIGIRLDVDHVVAFRE